MSIKRTIITTTVALAVVAMVAPGVAQGVTIAELQAQINALLAQLATLQGGSTTTTGSAPAVCAGVTFSRNLTVGSTGSDVKCLQAILNQSASTKIAATGAGSPGSETTYFGGLTLAAVKKYQTANGILPANQVGPLTRAKLNAVVAGGTGTGTGTGTVTTPGALTVNLAGDTPASSSVADSANANFTKVTMSAGAGDVSISKIYVTRSGLSSNSDLENIKVVDASNNTYYGSIGSLNTDNKAMITFTQNLIIPANTTRTFFLRAGFVDGATAGRTASLGIGAASDITSNATSVNGSFPIVGNPMSVVSLTIGSAAVAEDGTTIDTTPDVGDTDVTLNQFKVSAGSTEAITIETITMLKSGTVSNSYLSNLELYDVTGGKTLGTVPSLNAEGKASWSNLNIVVGKGNTQRFKIMADIVDGPSLTAKADIVDGSDVLMTVKGNTYGYYITPSATSSWNGEPTNPQTINSGALTMSKSASTPATGNTSAGDDRVLAVFDFDARGEQVKISSTKLTATLGSSAPLYSEVTNVKLYDENGNIVAGPGDLTTVSATSATVTFTDTYIVPVGVHKYTVKAKLASTVSSGDTVKFSIASASDVTAKGMTSNSTINPTGTPAGNTMTVAAGALVVKTLTTPAARSVAVGIQDFIWATASLSAVDSGEDVQVTAVTVTDTLNAAADEGDSIDNAEIWADLTSANSSRGDVYETKVSNTEQPDDNATATETQAFTLTQTITVKAGSEVRIALVADLAAGASTDDKHTFTFSDTTQNGASTGTSFNETTSGSGQQMTVTTGGTLTISKDSSSPVADIVLGGETSTLAVFRLAANNVEDLDVDDMTFNVTNGTLVDTFYFYNGSTLLGSAAGGNTPSVTLADGTLTVPANGNVKVTVKGKFIAGTEMTTANNNSTITATIEKNAGDAINTTGKASGTEVDSDANTATGNGMDLYKTRPYVTLAATGQPSTVLNATTNQLLGVFDVRAAAGEDVTFEQADTNLVTFQVSTTQADTEAGSLTYYLKDENGNTLATSTFTDGGTSVTFYFDGQSHTIAAGSTGKWYVYGDLSHLENDGDTIRVWLDDGTATNIDWGINGTGSYNDADKVFRSDIYGPTLVNPS